jgi:hypothetical protein
MWQGMVDKGTTHAWKKKGTLGTMQGGTGPHSRRARVQRTVDGTLVEVERKPK